MISFVEGPYFDEPMFGFLARIYARLIGPTRSQFNQYLLGRKKAVVHFDFPNYLTSLEDSIGNRIGLSGADFIERTTMVPVIAPFFLAERVQRIQTVMLSDAEPAASLVMWRREVNSEGKRRLRFCKKCRLLDLETKPHTWWRRTHQVPGVVCCPDHGVALSVSQFVDGESWKLDYPLADDAQEIAKTPKPDELDHFVASGVQWLLNNKVITLEVGARRDVFMERLTIKGLTRGGQLRRTFFLESFSAQRTAEAWKERNLIFDASHASAWPAQIAISKSNHHSPVMHLLLMKFLGFNVQEFMMHAIDSNRPRHPTNRISLDAELARQLVALWADTNKTIEGICRELSISRDCVLSLARNLKLKLPRAENKKKAHLIMIKRGELRLKWVDRMRIPEKERMRVCRWLSRYDRPWLHKHFGYKAPRTFKVDWSARDQLLLKMVPYVIAKIRAQLPFRRITKKAIIELLPYSNSTQIRMHLLPLLAQEIKARNETINEFILRRVKTIRQVSPELAPWAVREQASVPWSCRTPAIMSAMGYRFVGERWLATPETADRAGYGLLANPKTN